MGIGNSSGGSPRILELLALAEEQPTVSVPEHYLVDPDPQVRSTAIVTLTETTPVCFGPALVAALQDEEPAVRAAAVSGLRELAEVLTADEALDARLRATLSSSDAQVRATVVDLLRALRLGDPVVFGTTLADQDSRVRLQAVCGLVSLDQPELITTAAQDPIREVRVAVAADLGAIGDPSSASALAELSADTDVVVRAAALEAAGRTRVPGTAR